LFDADGEIVGLKDVLDAIRAQVRFKGSKSDSVGEYSAPVVFNRTNHGLMLGPEIPNRRSVTALQKLDLHLNVLYEHHYSRLSWVVVGSTICDMTNKRLSETKTKSIPAMLPNGINKMKQRLLKNAGVYFSLTDEESVGGRSVHYYGGHAVRGNAGSTLDAVHRLGVVNYPADEHLIRARHTLAVFEKAYKRTHTASAPVRVMDYMRSLTPEVARQYAADDVLFA
jgi:hypothetical protein